jgi:hypothetical protein
MNPEFTAASKSLEQRRHLPGAAASKPLEHRQKVDVASPMVDVAHLGFRVKSQRWLPMRRTGDAVLASPEDRRDI